MSRATNSGEECTGGVQLHQYFGGSRWIKEMQADDGCAKEKLQL